MSEPAKQEIIIVRRYEAEEENHKGGVWKIAHADFMTAMMAFFLVMWLISVADKETRTSVANYFNPVQLAESTPDRKGLQDPQNNAAERAFPGPIRCTC
jgi:chemotaxis protein MotB